LVLAEEMLDFIADWFKLCFEISESLLLLVRLGDLAILLCDTKEFVVGVILWLLEVVFVDGFDYEEYLGALMLEVFEHRRQYDSVLSLLVDPIDALLLRLDALDVLAEGR
jgi:hypothetical protein